MAKRVALRRTLKLGFLAGLGYAIWRAIEANRSESPSNWEPQPFPFPPQPREPREPTPPVVDAVDGVCPASHPVKAKRSSEIYHVPGGSSYERTKADRCYLDAAAAEADGLRPAKR